MADTANRSTLDLSPEGRSSPARSALVVILAAGEGTRMRSSLPKVLHPVGGLPLVGHALKGARAAGATERAVVLGVGADTVRETVSRLDPDARTFVQAKQRGTADAVLAAREALQAGLDDVLVLFGDTPFVRGETLQRVRERLAGGADVVVLGFHAADPGGYGRLILSEGRLVAIREEKDASAEERAITLCNSGVMGFRGAFLPGLLEAIGNDNAKKEFYLTDAVAIAAGRGLRVEAVIGEEGEFLGVNDRADLARAEAVFQARARAAALAGGATLVAPETVHFSHDTQLGRDVVIEPYVVFGPGVVVEDGALIRAFSHLEGARVAGGARVGPFARLRPGAVVESDAHIGNFVEVKAARIEAGAKVNHLSYIGDGRVGAGANIGAGAITCNYDGFAKHFTDIGPGAFIGSNAALVAPVRVGEGAYVGSGSVITDDVPADALALGRGRQVVKEGWAAGFRAARKAEKAAKG